MLWKAVICEDLYGAKAESVLSETQNSWVNNKQTCSNYPDKFVLVSTNENQCKECLCCVLTIYNTVLKNIRKNVIKNLTKKLTFPYRSDVVE